MTALEQAIEQEVQRRVAAEWDKRLGPAVVYTVDEAAEKLHVSRRTVYSMISAGELKKTAHPRKVLVPASEIARVLG